MKFFIILFLPFSIYSQQVLSSGGNSPSLTNEKTISFTVGEPLITTGVDGQIVTQGFHQPLEKGNVYVSGVNAFSPNGDNNNDAWQFKKPSEKYKIEIFSRWGNIVWDNESDLTESEWNGTDKNQQDVPDGTYFYTITLDGKTVENGSGFIEVTR